MSEILEPNLHLNILNNHRRIMKENRRRSSGGAWQKI
jgi:hypothetical protein